MKNEQSWIFPFSGWIFLAMHNTIWLFSHLGSFLTRTPERPPESRKGGGRFYMYVDLPVRVEGICLYYIYIYITYYMNG